MRFFVLLPVIAALVAAAPTPQEIDFDAVAAAPDPTYTIVPGLRDQDVAYNPTSAVSAAVADITANPLPVDVDTEVPVDIDTPDVTKRNVAPIVARAACTPEPTSPNTYNVDLSSAANFRADGNIATKAKTAVTPSGYYSTFKNLQAASSANGYLGYSVVAAYDPSLCAAKCDKKTGCIAFNICSFFFPSLEGCD